MTEFVLEEMGQDEDEWTLGKPSYGGQDPDNYESEIISNYTGRGGVGNEEIDVWIAFEWDGEDFQPYLLSNWPITATEKDSLWPCCAAFETEQEGWSAYFDIEIWTANGVDQFQMAKMLLEWGVAPDQPVKVRLFSEYTCDCWGEHDAEFSAEPIEIQPIDAAETLARWEYALHLMQEPIEDDTD